MTEEFRVDLRGALLSEHARQVQDDLDDLIAAAREVVDARWGSIDLAESIDVLADAIDRITA